MLAARGLTKPSNPPVPPKMPIPGVGYFAICMDAENNVFGIFEDDKNAK